MQRICPAALSLTRVKYQLPEALLITGYSLIHAPFQLVNESELRHGLFTIRYSEQHPVIETFPFLIYYNQKMNFEIIWI